MCFAVMTVMCTFISIAPTDSKWNVYFCLILCIARPTEAILKIFNKIFNIFEKAILLQWGPKVWDHNQNLSFGFCNKETLRYKIINKTKITSLFVTNQISKRVIFIIRTSFYRWSYVTRCSLDDFQIMLYSIAAVIKAIDGHTKC